MRLIPSRESLVFLATFAVLLILWLCAVMCGWRCDVRDKDYE